MKAVILSIRPQWCEKIVSGKKTIEVRKTAPKEVPFKAYIYCSKEKKQDDIIWAGAFGDRGKWNGHVIGEFICDKVYNLVNAFGGIVFADENLNQLEPQLFRDMSCLTDEQTADYLGDKDGYGWHISDLKIYDKPKKLSEFYRPCSYSGICYSCNRFRPNGTPNDEPNDFCDGEIIRPPQSYMYVKEVVR